MRTKNNSVVSKRIDRTLKILLGVFVAALSLGVIIAGHSTQSLVVRNASPIGFVCLIGVVLYVRTKLVDCMFDGM